MTNDATAEPSSEVHREFSFDEDACNEIRASLDGVKTTLCDHLSKEFGHVKKAPDDHPILKAIQSIEAIIYVFDTEGTRAKRRQVLSCQ